MKIGIIDIETTGFLNKGGKIVEIGIATLDTETGVVTEAFHSICKEAGMTVKDRDAWIFKNSDLTVELVRNAPDLMSIKNDIQEVILQHDAVTAYNKAFDFDFLRSRQFEIRKEWPCPMLAATPLCKCEPFKRGSYKWPKVEEAWMFFFPDQPYTELHRGLDDAMHEAKIVYALFTLKQQERNQINEQS